VNRLAKHKDGEPRIGVIGCGAITEAFYLPAIMKMPNVARNAVLIDRDLSRVRGIAEKNGIKDYMDNYRDILGEVQGVIIALPNHLHCEVSMEFLKQGIHVLCEKPLAENMKEAREMVDQAKAANVTLSVNNTRRLYPAYKEIRKLIQNGSIGRLGEINYINGFRFQWPTASGFYFNHNRGKAKGVLFDQGSHVIDAVCWWIGAKPKVISCETDSHGGCEGMAVVGLKSGECKIEIKLSWLSELKNTFKIAGEEGTIEGKIEEWNGFRFKRGNGESKKISMNGGERNYREFGEKLLNNFIDVITHQAQPIIPGKDVLDSIEVIEECYRIATKMSDPWYENLEVQHGR